MMKRTIKPGTGHKGVADSRVRRPESEEKTRIEELPPIAKEGVLKKEYEEMLSKLPKGDAEKHASNLFDAMIEDDYTGSGKNAGELIRIATKNISAIAREREGKTPGIVDIEEKLTIAECATCVTIVETSIRTGMGLMWARDKQTHREQISDFVSNTTNNLIRFFPSLKRIPLIEEMLSHGNSRIQRAGLNSLDTVVQNRSNRISVDTLNQLMFKLETTRRLIADENRAKFEQVFNLVLGLWNRKRRR
jgi:hypothetical protein